MSGLIDHHPQRQQIIEGILSGESLRHIATRINPTIHHATLGRFRLKLLQTATKPLTQNHPISHSFKDLVTVATGDDGDMRAAERLAMGLRGELSTLVRAKLSRRERWIKDAEGRPILDEDARPIIREDGIPITQMDHKALAAHDRNETADLDVLGKLGQLYGEAPTQDSGVRALMSFGDVTVNIIGTSPSVTAADGDQAQVIEAIAEEVVDVSSLRGR